jgi:thiosulfate/3-mercaptopyruvate sulfurtransferase
MADYARGDILVEGAWLQEHLNDPNMRIVDCDVRDAYRKAHIPGAVFPSDTFLKNPDDRRFVMTPEQFIAEMKSLGISDDTLVIAYDQAAQTAARMWWALNYYGHTNVKVLNGNWLQWVADGRPISTRMESFTADKPFTPKANESLYASAEYIMSTLDNPDVVVWDVRSDGEWDGTVTRGNKRQGHMPGAKHLEWTHNYENSDVKRWKSADALKAQLDAIGVTPDKEVVTVCQGGIRAAQALFTLKLLGYEKVRNYDGSFSDWGNRDDTLIVTD